MLADRALVDLSLTRNGSGVFPSGCGLIVLSRACGHLYLWESADQTKDG